MEFRRRNRIIPLRCLLVTGVLALFASWLPASAQGEQSQQWVTIDRLLQQPTQYQGKTVVFMGIQRRYLERGAQYFEEQGIPAQQIPSALKGDNVLGLVVTDFNSEIFVIADRKYVSPPLERGQTPSPSTVWLVGAQVKKLRDTVYVEVVDMRQESKWKGMSLFQTRHWVELIAVLLGLTLLNGLLFWSFFHLTEKPSGSVRSAHLLCLWGLTGYLLLREPFRSFFAIGTTEFWIVVAVSAFFSICLLFSLLARGN